MENQKKPNLMEENVKPLQDKLGMALICFFVGGFGVHRYMMGYSNWWLMLITLGGCGIWTLVDFITILTGSMKMADGRDLKE
ncbi:MAG: TM2 domain-containing protein [Chitinophagales bacterium]